MIDWIDKHLVPEARQWWKLWSARLLMLALAIDAAALLPVLQSLPPGIRDEYGPLLGVIEKALIAAALFARFVKQSKLEKPDGE